MKLLLTILIIQCTQFAQAQFSIEDSLVTDPVSFNNLLAKMKEIDTEYSMRNSTTYSIPSAAKWSFICSYKNGWNETIGFSSKDSSVKMYRQDFNDIHIQRNGSAFYTTDELKKIFYINDSRITKDSSGNIISSPMVMTKDENYLLIGLGSYYPNGNQTSWDYRYNFYFKKQQE